MTYDEEDSGSDRRNFSNCFFDISPTLGLSPDDFVILLTHTPDYAEDVPITNTRKQPCGGWECRRPPDDGQSPPCVPKLSLIHI